MGRNLVNKARDPFAEKAMRIRIEKGIKQTEISNRLGYQSNEYARIETGFRPMKYELLPHLCEILGVPPNTFDDVIQQPQKKNDILGQLVFERLEQVRTQVFGLPVPEFAKAMNTTASNYKNIQIAHHPLVKYIQRLIKKGDVKHPRLSYSYLLEGVESPEVKLRETLLEKEKQLQQAINRITELERLVKSQSEKMKDLEIIKSLASRIYINT